MFLFQLKCSECFVICQKVFLDTRYQYWAKQYLGTCQNQKRNLFFGSPFSRCGKTFFVCDMLQNINSFCKTPPISVIFVCKVWQEKFEEMKNCVHKFIKDGDHVMDRIKENFFGNSTLVILMIYFTLKH